MKKLYLKHKEIFRYVFFGFCTTFVNWSVHFLIVTLFPMVREDPTLNTVATVIAWICAVVFSFFVNKKWVFEEQSWDLKSTGAQFIKFVGARMLTLGTDAVIAYACTQPLNQWTLLKTLPIIGGKPWVPWLALKVTQAAVSMVVNYLFSKFVVFRKVEKLEE